MARNTANRTNQTQQSPSKHLMYMKNAVLLYTTVGLGIGLVIILLSEFGTYPFELTSAGEMTTSQMSDLNEQFYSTVAMFTILISVVLAPILGGLTGYWAGSSIPDSNQAVIYGAVATFLGSFVFVVLVIFLSSTALTEEATLIAQVEGVDFGGVIVNSIVVGIASAVSAAGAAYGSAVK